MEDNVGPLTVMDIPLYTKDIKCYAAGILPFFDYGRTILLGEETRKIGDNYEDVWMEFGGKLEPGETLAQAAYRECDEETARSRYYSPTSRRC